jgi:hypothetical protein
VDEVVVMETIPLSPAVAPRMLLPAWLSKDAAVTGKPQKLPAPSPLCRKVDALVAKGL